MFVWRNTDPGAVVRMLVRIARSGHGRCETEGAEVLPLRCGGPKAAANAVGVKRS